MPEPVPAPDFDSRPEAIRRAIEARIIDGKMQPGDRLGLKADLQREFDVAGPTISQALTLLTNDGLIAMRRGPGGGIFVERSRPVIRVGTRRLATGTAQSLAENIETREWLTPLLAVSAARATDRDETLVTRLRELADRLVGAHPSFDTQRLIWSGHHAIVDLADNELVGHFYRDLLDIAEALIVDVAFPSEGIPGDQERQRIATHASMFVAVADGNVEAARHHAELVRLISRPLRESSG
ncbi:MAG: GntR family transcriptional regulator [Desertimonas sp.]|nr:GntR family transcriptional regulator [Desertimonas sp.]